VGILGLTETIHVRSPTNSQKSELRDSTKRKNGKKASPSVPIKEKALKAKGTQEKLDSDAVRFLKSTRRIQIQKGDGNICKKPGKEEGLFIVM